MFQAEKYYHSLLTFGIRPGLDRIKLLLSRLGNPERELNVIHVAGTNGKGTVCSFLAEILKENGFKTGLYTSPYIVNFRERIKINGEMIGEGELNSITERVKKEIQRLSAEDIVITEFEAVTAAAFLYFYEERCDFVVLETGLGGRFDATNVVENPLACVITSISLDHTDILGDTLSQIAYEKCGIIKKGAPVITPKNQEQDAMRMIREQCRVKGGELFTAGGEGLHILSDSIKGSEILYKGRSIFVPFPGEHQAQNAAAALECIAALKMNGVSISEKAIKNGIEKTKNPARCEIIGQSPLLLLDGCHNEDSAAALSRVLEKYLSDKKITAVIGMMADKAVDRVLELLTPYFSKAVAVTPSNPRAISAAALSLKIKKQGVDCQAIENPVLGSLYALSHTSPEDVVLVCGSLYLCADVRESLLTQQNG